MDNIFCACTSASSRAPRNFEYFTGENTSVPLSLLEHSVSSLCTGWSKK